MNLARYRELAMAAPADPWSYCGQSHGDICSCRQIWSVPNDCVIAKVVSYSDEEITGGSGINDDTADATVTFIAANSPEVVLAFIALAEADDPEPQRDQADAYDKWLIRQELRANIDRVLGGGEE